MANTFLSPEEALYAEQQARYNQALQMGATPVGASAQELGRTIAGAFGSAFGAPPQESPYVQQARTRQNLVKGLDLTNPESLANAARTAINAGDVEFGTVLADRYMRVAELASKSAGDGGTNAQRQLVELIKQGVDPYQAQGIAYGTYRQVTDPSTGDILMVDLRRGNTPLSSGETRQIETVVRSGNRKQEKFESNLQNLAQDVEKAEIPRVESALSSVETLINELSSKGQTDVPGFGATHYVPGFALSDEGRALRQRVATLFNMTLKDRSGAAVTESEFNRLKDEFYSGAISTDKQLLDALKIARKSLEDHKKAIAGGYDPSVVEEYQNRSNLNIGLKKKGVTRYVFNPATGQLEPK